MLASGDGQVFGQGGRMKMKLILLFAFVFVSVNGHASNSYIIKLKKSSVRTQGAITVQSLRALNQLGVKIRSTIPELGMVVGELAPAQAALFAQAAQGMIEYIEPNYKLPLFKSRSNPASYDETGQLWGMKVINAAGAWTVTTGSKSVIIAVSDTGAWKLHPDLQENIWKNPGETGKDSNGKDKSTNGVDDDGNGYIDDVIGWNFETDNNDPRDDHYHGTHVSGTIGAAHNGFGVVGVNWNTSIMVVKFIGGDGSGTSENGIRTIIYAAQNGAKALNASWGGDDYSQAFVDALDYAKERGMLFVAAAGNDGTDNDKIPAYPASYENENVISVASISGFDQTLSYFSCYGLKSVDLAAPGERIFSTFNPMYSSAHRDWYYYLDGTSMAAPHVTGAVGLIYAANPKLNWRQVKDILLSTVTQSQKLKSKILTGGILNVEAAVKKAIALNQSN